MQKDKMNEIILEYMLKIPILKNNLITGEDSFNLSDREYSDIMQGIQNNIIAAKKNIKEPELLQEKLNNLNFQKGELKIERIIHVRNQEKKLGNKTESYDEKLLTLIKYQNFLLNANKNNSD